MSYTHIVFSHCFYTYLHTLTHTAKTECPYSGKIYLLGSHAARSTRHKQNKYCRHKLISLTQGTQAMHSRARQFYSVLDLDELQLFLPWSWTNPQPDAHYLFTPGSYRKQDYFPYCPYIFNRALMTDEERSEDKCRCFHYLPRSHPPGCWYDWPCGCLDRGRPLTPKCINEVPACFKWLIDGPPELLDQAYIFSPTDLSKYEGYVRFRVPARQLSQFPASRKRKRRSAFGRALSLSDRKHYKMGRPKLQT